VNIKEFENYLYFVDSRRVHKDMKNYEDYLNYLLSVKFYSSFRILKQDFVDRLEAVEPIEDRDFLILKYSNILAITIPTIT